MAFPLLLLGGGALLAGSQIGDITTKITNFFSPTISSDDKAVGINFTPANIALTGAGVFLAVKAFKMLK